MNERLILLIGLQAFQLAEAQGQIGQLGERVAQLEAELAARTPRRKKAE